MKGGWTLWFTGLHGSGKSTIAKEINDFLSKNSVKVILLDGDELRKTISADLGYSIEERNEHMKRVANLCKSNSEKGILSITSVASPTEKSREYARSVLKKFFLVYVRCPLEVAAKRDVKGHYKKAKENQKGFEHFLKVSSNFEEPKNPDIVLNTDEETVQESVDNLIKKLKENGIIDMVA
jgi:adenylylsulfate kinase